MPSGGHYQSMISQGIPHAIAWALRQGARPQLPGTTLPTAAPTQLAAAPPTIVPEATNPSAQTVLTRSDDLATSGVATRGPSQPKAVELQSAPPAKLWNVEADGYEAPPLVFADRKLRVPLGAGFNDSSIGLTANASAFVAVAEPNSIGLTGIWNLATARPQQVNHKGTRLAGLLLSNVSRRHERQRIRSVWSCCQQ